MEPQSQTGAPLGNSHAVSPKHRETIAKPTDSSAFWFFNGCGESTWHLCLAGLVYSVKKKT